MQLEWIDRGQSESETKFAAPIIPLSCNAEELIAQLEGQDRRFEPFACQVMQFAEEFEGEQQEEVYQKISG